jgi:hypothetical protein
MNEWVDECTLFINEGSFAVSVWNRVRTLPLAVILIKNGGEGPEGSTGLKLIWSVIIAQVPTREGKEAKSSIEYPCLVHYRQNISNSFISNVL